MNSRSRRGHVCGNAWKKLAGTIDSRSRRSWPVSLGGQVGATSPSPRAYSGKVPESSEDFDFLGIGALSASGPTLSARPPELDNLYFVPGYHALTFYPMFHSRVSCMKR